jgi:anti-anti-sigma factor
MVLNLKGVARVDSSGLGELFLLHSLATKVGARLVLAATPARVLDLLALTRVDGIFPSFADEHAAIGAGAASNHG